MSLARATNGLMSPPAATISSSISTTRWLAPPCSGPGQSMDSRRHRREKVGLSGTDHPYRGSRTVLLVICMEDEQDIQGFTDDRVDLVGLGWVGEHHVQEVGHVVEIIAGIDIGLVPAVFV